MIGENLILPSAVGTVTTLLVESSAKQLLYIPLSNDTVCRRIADIVEDLNEQLSEKIKNKSFAIQIDEAMNNVKDAHLIMYIRLVDESKIKEDLLFCKEFMGTSRAEELSDVIDSFMNLSLLTVVGLGGHMH
jgi:hypothetical protein